MDKGCRPVLGLLYGEATGIGSELVAKALQQSELRHAAVWVLIGDERVFQQGADVAGCTLDYRKVASVEEIDKEADALWLLDTANTDPQDITFGEISVASGKASGDNLAFASKLAREHQLDGVVYAPFNKDALYQGGYQFEDDIHLLASQFDCTSGFSEINIMDNLWVSRVTSHIPLKDVAKHITKDRVLNAIHFANDNLQKAGFTNPRIAVAALNPHAGDGGLLGMEEIEIIRPAIQTAQEAGVNVEGPYPADTILLRLETDPFDCLLAMYHDQAQIGMKLMGFHRGVTLSAGLPVFFNTPAHGTAFDIAGKGVANPGAMIHAMKMAVTVVSNKGEEANGD